jgi:hypothetical protein
MNRFRTALAAACLVVPFLLRAARAEDLSDDPVALVRQLGADDIQTRDGAQKKLLGMGPRAAAAVKAGTDSSDPEIRARCELIHPRLAWSGATTPPFDTLVPPSTLLYVGSPDVAGMWGRFRKSHAGTLAFHAAARPIWEELETDMVRHEEGRVMKYIVTDLLPKASGQFMLALTHIGGDAGRENFFLIFALQHQDADAALVGIDKAVKGSLLSRPGFMLEGAGPFHGDGWGDDSDPDRKSGAGIGVVANALVFFGSENLGTAPAAQFLRRWRDGAKDPGFSADPVYAAFRKQFPASDLYAFLDVDKLLDGLRRMAAGRGGGEDSVVKIFTDGLGLGGLRAAFASLAFRDDGQIEENLVLQTREGGRGILGLFAFKPLDPALNGLRFAPRDAALAATARLDPGQAMRRIQEIAGVFGNMHRAPPDPDAKPRDLDAEWNAQAKAFLGVDAAAALDLLGGEISLVGLVDEASPIPRGVLAIESPRPAELLNVLKGIPVLSGLGEWKTAPAGGVDLHRLVAPDGEPPKAKYQLCLAATATHVLVASHPEAARRVLELRAGGGKTMAEADDVQAALAELPKGVGAVSCVNTRRLVAWGIAQLKANAAEVGLSEDLAKRLAALPPADELTKGWKPSVFGVAVGDRETRWKGLGSLPLVNLNVLEPMMLALFTMRGF